MVRQWSKTVQIEQPLPLPLSRRIDQLLRDSDYNRKHDHVYRRDNDPMWLVANEMPIRFSVVKRIYSELVKRFPTLDPDSILDYGCRYIYTCVSLSLSLSLAKLAVIN